MGVKCRKIKGIRTIWGGSGSKAADESKEILLWSSATGPDGERIQKTIDNYNETNPEYTVKFVSMQADTFNTKLSTAGRSGEGVPDLALVASESLPTYNTQQMLVAWDDFIQGTELKKENYVESAWNVGNLDGAQYGIPATMGSWVMFYNEDLMNKYAPNAMDDGYVTYEEIEAAGEAAKADGIYSYANTWSMQNYSNLYLQMGGEWLQGNQLEWVKSGANPSALAMLENEEYLAMPQSFLLTTEEGRDAININAAEGLTYVFGEYDARAWDMITGKADIEDTFEEIQKIVNEKMK